MKKKGFTLIELLAVIVILGVIMIIAIPSVTSYITNARKDSYISDAKMFVNAAKTKLTADATLPQEAGGKVIVPISDIALDKGGEKSPYGNDWDYNKSFVVVENQGTSSDPNYVWQVALNDSKGNCIPLTAMSDLRRELVGTACTIIGIGDAELNHANIIPEGAIYYSNLTNFDVATLTPTAEKVYSAGEEFPEIKFGDVYVYGDYVYGYKFGLSLDDGLALYTDETITGWGVMLKDKTKTSYGDVLQTINNQPITYMGVTYMGTTEMTIAPKLPDTVTNMAATFALSPKLTTVEKLPRDLIYMNSTFYDCDSLVYSPEIPSGVKYMKGTYTGSSSLLVAPELPAGLLELDYAFEECFSLKTAPSKIPAGVTDLSWTFYSTSITNTPILHEKITNLQYTFMHTDITTAPKIPGTVTNMEGAFSNCDYLQGEVEIDANPTDYENAFLGIANPIKLIGNASDATKAALAATAGNGNVTY